MRCSRARKLMRAYVSSEINDRESDLIGEHISRCEDCRKEERAMKALVTVLEQQPDVVVEEVDKERLKARVLNRLEELQSRGEANRRYVSGRISWLSPLRAWTFVAQKHGLRHKVLLRVKSTWTDNKLFSFRFNLSRFARGYAYALGLALLVSIVSAKIDSVLTNNVLNGEALTAKHIEEVDDMENLYTELELEHKTGRSLVRITAKEQDDETQINMFEQRKQIMKELSLTNGGLS